ncbi:akirin-2 isoform 3-T3 [Trichechus inunguis]|uniref:Akirin-2 n=1 Tax=Trichechus manatus latirostris TaxID=127582 RepID=A0A2Y9RVV5_TRIMA|nr:akirin-2 isoform X3 [Trichechus manatus latirostris]
MRSYCSYIEQAVLAEQILYNIKQEYKRMQKRRHLETSFQQTDPCCTSDAQPHAFLLSGPASPGTSSATSSPLKKEQPLFTLRQVGMICERLLKEREEKVREEYEEILNTKLAEQYDAFVKFTHDQIMRRYGEQPASCKYFIFEAYKLKTRQSFKGKTFIINIFIPKKRF